MSERNHVSISSSKIAVDGLLAHPYRRYLLYYLHLYANPVQLADVAHQITIWETNKPADDLLKKRLRIYTALYHDHLPELIDSDIVEYNQEEDMLELGPPAAELVPAIERRFRDDVDELLQAERCTFEESMSQ